MWVASLVYYSLLVPLLFLFIINCPCVSVCLYLLLMALVLPLCLYLLSVAFVLSVYLYLLSVALVLSVCLYLPSVALVFPCVRICCYWPLFLSVSIRIKPNVRACSWIFDWSYRGNDIQEGLITSWSRGPTSYLYLLNWLRVRTGVMYICNALARYLLLVS